jgi:hypothetical protein|tara:strand:- start:197 stop:499 length:303 start_codon:yes stop_codon:yes gene_type:complete
MREEIKKARLKKKVLRQYPNAKPVQSTDGIQIHAGDIFIAKEYYMPSTRCIDTAWEYAAIACKTTQNFNRTHPMKMELGAIEEKINRINRRKRRGRKNAK